MSQTLQQPLVECGNLYAEYAEKLGHLAVPQFYAIRPVTMDDGSEWALSVGPLRYTRSRAERDALDSPGATALVFVVRFCNPDDPEDLKAYADHKRAELAEKGAA